jgi:L-alanine-DL-glutamate epimerase-like enolase superfamily enzyme
VVRIVTDQGVSGYGQAESAKPYLKPMVLFYKDYILGEDPTDVERVMLKIRRLGAFKPWGSAVSAIEIALWDIAGQVAGVPVYKLLGGKIRDRVRAYNGAVRFPMTGQTPRDYAENMAKMKEAKEGFTLIKQAVGFHNPAMMHAMPNGWYDEPRTGASHPDRGLMTERGLKHIIACVEAMKKVLGDETGLALDCGPGWTVIRNRSRLRERPNRSTSPKNRLWMLSAPNRKMSADWRKRSGSRNTPISTASSSLPAEFSTGLSRSPRMFSRRPPCRKTTSPSSIPWASRSGGIRLSTDCRTRS